MATAAGFPGLVVANTRADPPGMEEEGPLIGKGREVRSGLLPRIRAVLLESEGLKRLRSISSVSADSGLAHVFHAYHYGQANQRDQVTLADGSSWLR